MEHVEAGAASTSSVAVSGSARAHAPRSLLPRTAVTGAIASRARSTSGVPMSPACTIRSTPRRRRSASGRRSPCVSDTTPMTVPARRGLRASTAGSRVSSDGRERRRASPRQRSEARSASSAPRCSGVSAASADAAGGPSRAHPGPGPDAGTSGTGPRHGSPTWRGSKVGRIRVPSARRAYTWRGSSSLARSLTARTGGSSISRGLAWRRVLPQAAELVVRVDLVRLRARSWPRR